MLLPKWFANRAALIFHRHTTTPLRHAPALSVGRSSRPYATVARLLSGSYLARLLHKRMEARVLGPGETRCRCPC